MNNIYRYIYVYNIIDISYIEFYISRTTICFSISVGNIDSYDALT